MTGSTNTLRDLLKTASLEEITSELKGCDVNQLDEDGLAPLHRAATLHRPDVCDVITLLIQELGCHVDCLTRETYETPLHLTVKSANPGKAKEICALLLELGADKDNRDISLRTAYDYALARALRDVTSLLEPGMVPSEDTPTYHQAPSDKPLPRDHEPDELVNAVIHTNTGVIPTLLADGLDPNYINKYGAGAVHYTITHYQDDKQELLRMLIDNGAHVNLTDHEGDTALNLAIKMPGLRQNGLMAGLVRLLRDEGTDPTVKDIDDYNAFDLARKRGYQDILDLIERKETKPKTPSPDPTPEPEEPEQTEEITEEEPETEAPEPDVEPEVPETDAEQEAIVPEPEPPPEDEEPSEKQSDNLHEAAENNDITAVKTFLLLKADIRAKNEAGETPADVALRLGHQEIYDLLEEHRRQDVQEKWKKGAKKARICIIS